MKIPFYFSSNLPHPYQGEDYKYFSKRKKIIPNMQKKEILTDFR